MKKIFIFLFFAFASIFANDKELKVGVSPDYKPFDYKENNQLTGFDIDLVEEIAKRQGIKIKWVQISFDGLIPALKSGKIDMIASGMSSSEDRKKHVDFTVDYYDANKDSYLKLKENTSINDKNDLENKKIGVQLGSIQENTAKNIKNSKIVPNEDIGVAILSLKKGKLDAVIIDEDVAKGFLKENSDLVVFLQEDNHNASGFSFAFDKNKNKDLIEKFNQTIKDIKTDGTYKKIVSKYDL